MTASDELRRMLDERGVEWGELIGHPVVVGTEWHDRDGCPCTALEHAGDVPDGMLSVQANLTPEQAIATTLGRSNVGRYVGLRQGKYWERTENSDYYCGGCGWKVTDHDSYCPECGGALHKATLGTGTCQDEGDPNDFCCSECGVRMFTNTSDTYTMIASDGRTIIKHPNYCPNCGRRIVEPTTNNADAEVTDG